MVKVVHFGEDFEKDLSRLGLKVREQQTAQEGSPVPDQEIVKQSLESYAHEVPAPAAPPANAASVPVSVAAPSAASSAMPPYVAAENPEVRAEVERLVEMAMRERLEKAIQEAKKHPPFVVDAFHDALVDRLIPELKKRGML